MRLRLRLARREDSHGTALSPDLTPVAVATKYPTALQSEPADPTERVHMSHRSLKDTPFLLGKNPYFRGGANGAISHSHPPFLMQVHGEIVEWARQARDAEFDRRQSDCFFFFHSWLAPLTIRSSPHDSRGFVTKPPRRQARRARGAVKEGGILETVC